MSKQTVYQVNLLLLTIVRHWDLKKASRILCYFCQNFIPLEPNSYFDSLNFPCAQPFRLRTKLLLFGQQSNTHGGANWVPYSLQLWCLVDWCRMGKDENIRHPDWRKTILLLFWHRGFFKTLGLALQSLGYHWGNYRNRTIAATYIPPPLNINGYQRYHSYQFDHDKRLCMLPFLKRISLTKN